MRKFYAHSLPEKGIHAWQPLETHLKNVAEKAQSFADIFNSGAWGYLAGFWHDIGKYSNEFQDMLMDASKIGGKQVRRLVDHSTAGAKHASIALNDKGKLLAYAISGHHAGLPDGESNENSCLIKRLEKKVNEISACPEKILDFQPEFPLPLRLEKRRFGFQLSFFVRMFFSCLVDADFLDTEEFMDEDQAKWRKGYPKIEDMQKKLKIFLDRLRRAALHTPINRQRSEILEMCCNTAENPQGLYSLTVPTGGGKTLSSLAFAMKHAIKHNLKRIIYVIPFTSIIEQNANIFRKIFGEDAVLEHHSNFEPREEDSRSRLAAENWDAPLIVTTNNQFFESLFSNRSSRCRKIHNIVKSVVILDEAQTLPTPLIKPCIEAIRELALFYNTTIVLCTATQPALSFRDEFKEGLKNIQEIIPDPKELYKSLERVKTKNIGTISDNELIVRLNKYAQALCIVNTRKHARTIYNLTQHNEKAEPPKNEFYHLSALMCPAHRSKKIEEIKKNLKKGLPCKVISTQLVEAGVDIDFPVVFRSIAGIDSIAQAAGRCNREGMLTHHGEIFIFHPDKGFLPGYLRQASVITKSVLKNFDDPLSLEAVEEYFRYLFWLKGEGLDEFHLLADIEEDACRGNFPFKEIAKKFRIIKDEMQTLIIPWGNKGEKVLNLSQKSDDFSVQDQRILQPYTVQLYAKDLAQLEQAGAVFKLQEWDNIWILSREDLYRDDIGLVLDDTFFYDVEKLIT